MDKTPACILFKKNMLRALPFLFCLFAFLYSCKQEKPVQYFWVHVGINEKTDTTPITRFEKLQAGDTTKISYFTAHATVTYFIINDKDSSFIMSNSKYFLRPKDSVRWMRSFHDTSVVIGKETFKVKNYVSDELVNEGASIHCYTVPLGIYANYSSFWSGLGYLQTNDTAINKQIYALLKASIPELFIHGRVKEILNAPGNQ